MLKVGVIGYGAIGRDVVKRIADGHISAVSVVAILRKTTASVDTSGLHTTDVDAFLATRPELVIEAAGQAALREYAPSVLRSGASLAVCSVGAFVDQDFEQEMRATAREHGARIYFPACALGGLDRVAAAAQGQFDQVRLVTRKPPSAWHGTDVESTVDLSTVTEPLRVFSGTSRGAAHRYPQNANVSAALGLAGAGLDETQVEVWVDPTISANVHEVEVISDSGRFTYSISNLPSGNPKTGVIVAMSLVKLLRNLTEPCVFGI